MQDVIVSVSVIMAKSKPKSKPCRICGEKKKGWHTWYKRTDKGHEGEEDVCPLARYS